MNKKKEKLPYLSAIEVEKQFSIKIGRAHV